MSSLRDMLSSAQAALLNKHRAENPLKQTEINIGDVFKIKMDGSNGITPKDGLDHRQKYFIVLGQTDDGTFYGGVVFNKTVNPNIDTLKQQLHVEIDNTRYPFLPLRKSYINCSSVQTVSATTIVTWDYAGTAPPEDVPMIISKLTDSNNRFVRKAELRYLGIIK